jgi:hypothetical protein
LITIFGTEGYRKSIFYQHVKQLLKKSQTFDIGANFRHRAPRIQIFLSVLTQKSFLFITVCSRRLRHVILPVWTLFPILNMLGARFSALANWPLKPGLPDVDKKPFSLVDHLLLAFRHRYHHPGLNAMHS